MMTLTLANNEASLASPLSNKAVGFSRPIRTGAKVMLHKVHDFFIARNFFMVGAVGGLMPAGTCSRSTNLMHLPPKSLVALVGSLKTIEQEAIMPKNHTPKFTKENKLTIAVSKKSKSRFNVLTRSGRSIARKVSFKTAINLKSGHPEFTIKFDSMGAQS